MDLTARDIHQKQFHDQWRGYSQEEVDDFLDKVAEVLDRVQQENASLRRRVAELEQQVIASREAEEMLKKTLVTAQSAAEEAIGKAKAKAEQMIAEAEVRSRREREDAQRRLVELESQLHRRSVEADRVYSSKRRELDASIERLRAYEEDMKQRLRAFLTQQLRSLEALASPPPPQTPDATQEYRGPLAASARSEPGAGRRDAGTPRPEPSNARPEAATPGSPAPGGGPPNVIRVEDRTGDEQGPGERNRERPEEASSAPQKRGVRGLFWREEP